MNISDVNVPERQTATVNQKNKTQFYAVFKKSTLNIKT